MKSSLLSEKRIALFLPNLHDGGAERVAVNLVKDMLGRNILLDLVLASAEGPYLQQLPKQVRLVNLGSERVVKAILPLSNYLRKNQPWALLSHMGHSNVVAVMARKLARTNTKLMLVEHNTFSASEASSRANSIRGKSVSLLMKLLYSSADYVVGVSHGVAKDLEEQLSLEAGKVAVIYNPVVDRELFLKAKQPLDHPWFEEKAPPVFLGVGRLTEQKDFSTLIKAFAILRKQIRARLIILGEGKLRNQLEAASKNLGIAEDVSLPGFVDNPYAYMSRANAFILSSRWEGLGNVLIEAMACGCPVIATDCPNGPREILESGKYGQLIEIGDALSLSTAMSQILESPVNRELLIQRSMYFSVERSTSNYLKLLDYN